MASRIRPLALRFEKQVELPAVIEAAAEKLALEFCDVSGFGVLEWIEIQTSGAEAPRRLQGPLDLLDLKGRLRRAGGVELADFVCTLSRATDSGIELLGGRLIAGRAEFVEITLVELEAAEVDAPPGPLAETAPAAEPKVPISGRWAEALAESKRQEHKARERGWDWDSDAEEVRPERGDIVVHRQFGRCQVVRLDDEHISLRKPDGRVVQLGLSILQFTSSGTEDGKAVYDVAVKKG
jgi:predicted DNA-binding protein with PD1-like motif